MNKILYSIGKGIILGIKKLHADLLESIFLLTVFVPLYCNADSGKWRDVVQQKLPKSPEAAAFDCIRDIPVSMYSGRSDLSIPLYTVVSGDLKLPISLDYAGRAIRVDQESTWVGLNWMLNAGGCIMVNSVAGHSNRTKSSLAPEDYYESWKHLFEEMNFAIGYAGGGEFSIPYKFDGVQPGRGRYGENWFRNSFCNDPNDIYPILYDEILNYHNGECPIYHAVFMGNNITFAWDPFKQEFFQTGLRKNFRIEGSIGSQIVLTDGKGIQYIFQFMEKVFPVSNSTDMDHFTYSGTFYLTTIKSPTGHVIRLNYASEGGYYPVRHITETLYSKNYPVAILINSYTKGGSNPTATTDAFPTATIDNLNLLRTISPYYCIEKFRLASITTDSLIVDFNAGEVRKDLNFNGKGSARTLDNIEIYKKGNGKKNILKKYAFTYGYFQKNETGGNTLKDYWRDMAESTDVYSQYYPNDDFMYLRLRLDKLQEFGSDGSSKPAYTFCYNDGLPGKNSAAQDYWGYYNGRENRSGIAFEKDYYDRMKRYHTLIPRHYDECDDGLENEDELNRYLNLYGADRRTNYRYVTAGMLSLVKYPTGGSLSLEYRQNTFSNYTYASADTAYVMPNYFTMASAHQDVIPNYRRLPTLGLSTSVSYEAVSRVSVYDCNQQTYSNMSSTKGSLVFLIERPQYVNVTVSYSKNNGRLKSYWKPFIMTPAMLLQYDIKVKEKTAYEYVCNGKALSVVLQDTVGNQTGTISKTFQLLLQPGKYMLSVPSMKNTTPDASTGVFYEVQADIYLAEQSRKWKAPSYGNGVSIAAVNRRDVYNVSSTRYSYFDASNWNTTGRLSSPAIFARKKMLVYQRGNDGTESYPPAKQIIYSYASSDNQCVNYGSVNYDRVSKTIYDENDRILKTQIQNFWNKNWVNGSLWYYIPTPEDPRNGLVISDSISDAKGECLKITSKKYKIALADSRLINAFVENLYYGPIDSCKWAEVAGGGIMNICLYSHPQFYMIEAKDSTSIITDNGVYGQSKYSVFNPVNGLPVSETVSTSTKGEWVTTKYLYPEDFKSLSMANELSKQHINEIPLKTFSYLSKQKDGTVSTTLRSSTITNYNKLGQPIDYYTMDIPQTLSINPIMDSVQSGLSLSGYVRRLSIDYDSEFHNPVVFTEQDGTISTLQWGYGGLYPIAMTKGKHTTRYEFQPYVGLTKITFPNGKTESYSYDEFQRLKQVTGMDGITHRYEYSFNDNYIKTESPLDAAGLRNQTVIQYYDKLGRVTLTATDAVGGTGKGVYELQEYDGADRIIKSFLQAADNTSGSLHRISSRQVSDLCSNTYGDEYAFSINVYDALDRQLFMQTPGKKWHDKDRGVRKEYFTNVSHDVLHYIAPMDGSCELMQSGYYDHSMLLAEKTIDADGHNLTIYTDKEGRKVLERRNGNVDTYYVYNDMGQLRFVLSPQYQSYPNKATMAYEYCYDSRGNVVKKILPGSKYIQYWYDGADRITFMQDAALRAKGRFRFTIYDAFGRLTLQGTCTEHKCSLDGTVVIAERASNDGIANSGYTIKGGFEVIGGDIILEIVNYYDNYDFLLGCHKKDFYTSSQTIENATGFQTGSIIRASNGQYIYNVMYYNDKGLLSATYTHHIDGSIMSTRTSYSFTDKPLIEEFEVRKNGMKLLNTKTSNTYNYYNDKIESVSLAVASKSASQTRCVVSYTYDDLGRISTLAREGKGGDVCYKYDVHGWITNIDAKDFKEDLYYADNPLGTSCYNGNISALRWCDAGYRQNGELKYRGYKFSYDELNRLGRAVYGEGLDLTLNPNHYNEIIDEYDLNGNIKIMKRYGLKQDGQYGIIDDLNYDYNGNQISKVQDAASRINRIGAMDFDAKGSKKEFRYAYNDNGALVSDESRGIALIEYDDCGNPLRIQFTNGNVTRYVYAATGQKLRTIHYTVVPNITVAMGTSHPLISAEILSKDSTDYNGAFILENDKPTMYQFVGGYCSLRDTTDTPSIVFHYYNQDHLGNNRSVVNAETGIVEQINNYYPFGTPFYDEANTTNASLQPFKYNGKELDMMHGLNTYDYGARQYNPVTLRWDRIDPLCEKYYSISPYVYCANNPVNSIDLDGCDTLNISYVNDKWVFDNPIVAEGDDIFNVTIDGETTSYTFSEGEYGERVCALNVEVNEDYSLGIYYVSASGEKGCGYYVTPGGDSSTKTGSGKRIPEGIYPILAPNGGTWQQPQVGGNVSSRGIRFHYGYPSPRKWTEGCFVLSSDYSTNGKRIQFSKQNSINAVQEFDYALGGGRLYNYSFTRNGKVMNRQGSKFTNKIKHKLNLKTR